MSDEVHEAYIRQLLEAHQVPQVTVAWQGGEPTLMGLDFFRRSVELQKKYQKPGTRIENTFQTNGILLDDEWCRFFHENSFLIGLSLDGPKELHDFYRKDKGGQGTFDRVVAAARLLQTHKVEFNILCTVNAKNSHHPLDVYRFFRDELGAHYIQFIPIVERDNDTGYQEGGKVTDRSVEPEQFGRFLIEIFDEWVKRDVGNTFVLNFDGALAGWLDMAGTVCIFGPTCGLGLALEHNGDLYSCDHFVEPDYYLGNILKTPMIDLVASEKQRKFGQDKKDTLPRYLPGVRFPAHLPRGMSQEPFRRDARRRAWTELSLRRVQGLLQARGQTHADHGRSAAPEPAGLRGHGHPGGERDGRSLQAGGPGRNDPCPCGSGRKFKQCHGQ